ncbi:DUF4132 domain-containing protein [Thermomonospora amylolytica]|uniref:DUF4132 domain-containing protein n=1 Tax=Thermomonospora amylolytica TaxID=1411117 RepID=UPI000E6BBEC5|nr:DUF4132 domain-containing protein [Thermomonospora amylolytica]
MGIPAASDEDVLTIPDAWRERLHPRRGGVPGRRIDVREEAPDVIARMIAEGRDDLEKIFGNPNGDPDLAGRAQAHCAGHADPAGAAAVAAELVEWNPNGTDAVVDAWVLTHGLAFAASACAEMADVRVDEAVRRGKPGEWTLWQVAECAERLRVLLAAADEGDYAEAVERLAGSRRTPLQRLLVSYLVPTRQDWVDECCQDPPADTCGRWWLLCALGSQEQLGEWARLDRFRPGVAETLAEGVGTAAAPLLADALDRLDLIDRDRGQVLDVLAALPGGRPFELLLERAGRWLVPGALRTAMKRFPVRTVRLLAGRADGDAMADTLLAEHLRAHPGLGEAVLAELPPPAREVVGRLLEEGRRRPEAAVPELPAPLADPPWKRAPRPRPVIKGLTPPGGRELLWEPDERRRWLDERPRFGPHYRPSRPIVPGVTPEFEEYDPIPEWLADHCAGRELYTPYELELFVEGPPDRIRPLLADWSYDFRSLTRYDLGKGDDRDIALRALRYLVAVYEMDAFPAVLAIARTDVGGAGGALMPFRDVEVARLMADRLMRVPSAGEAARAWLRRHGAAAVALLVPDALGRAGRPRQSAEAALHFLASAMGADDVVEAARVHGDEAATAIKALLALGRDEVVPRKIPSVGRWADPEALPQVLLRGRERALPAAAIPDLLTLLAMSPPEGDDPELAAVLEVCDPASLASFGWALFGLWQQAGAPARDGWVMTALGRLGDDGTVRRLVPLIRAWPGQGGHAKAVKGLDALALIGTDTALAELSGIAQRVPFKALRARAREKMEQVAAGLGLTGEQLADRLVPDFGLAADGTLTLDYGPRRFTVGFDEALKPQVTGPDGKARKSLPKPGAKDDPELAPAAYARFAELKKGVRTVASDQVRRLEAAMVTGRRWTCGEFRRYVVGHPLVWHIARRLVWITGDGVTFRLAEDRTFADVDDEELTLREQATVSVAHPVRLGESLTAWREVFDDYALVQPFPQLHRPVHALTDEERESGRLARFEGITVPWGKVLGLTRRGWERGVPQDNGSEWWITRALPGGGVVEIDLNPGIAVGAADLLDEDQTLEAVSICDRPGDHWRRRPTSRGFGDLDPVTASEILLDLTDLVTPSS